jgi:pimeloyl-ACP methyl ester carboxylesterase
VTAADILSVFYAGTSTSQAAGRASLARIFTRTDGRAKRVSRAAKDAQYAAIRHWGVRDWRAVARLTEIRQPTLILQGDNDLMVPTAASHTLAGLIPGAQLVLFPDASHGSIFQYPDAAATRTLEFLNT